MPVAYLSAGHRQARGGERLCYTGGMDLPEKVKAKLERLPDKPGVYLMRDRNGRVIYEGKAVSLRNRVRTYFRKAGPDR